MSTREAWHSQGLPPHVKPEWIIEFAYRETGGTQELPEDGPCFTINERMIPEFEEKVIEEREDTRVVQDWKGNICEISNRFSVEHLRNAVDFVTRRWIKYPVETRADWEEMKRRYDPDDPARLPDNPSCLAKELSSRIWPIRYKLGGPFWQLREWLGFENLCIMLHDDPDFVKEMICFWENYIARLLENAFKYVVPDEIHITEDMAYKSFSMISPAMACEFLLPAWERWGRIAREAEIPLYTMDSDGFIGELIPIWIDAGFNACDPIEVAAGNDIAALRKRFGKSIAFRGGIDKRAIAKGGGVIEDEIKRIISVIQSGGYIPGCDHGVPPDVSWPNFVYYINLLARATGWL